MVNYLPEGFNQTSCQFKNITQVNEAISCQKTFESRAIICDSDHNLIVDLGVIKGVIPKEECAMGISEGTTKDIAIISRVNKPVCFKILTLKNDNKFKPYAILSRKAVQTECIDNYIKYLTPGDIVKGKITHMESFGCFVDIGCGIISLLPIDAISVSRITHPKDRFELGQNINAIVKSIDDNGRICLSHKELLGTWEQNAALFNSGETVAGIIRSIESYGIFVELAPNLAGLAELKEGVKVGQHASVYIKNIIPERMKIKLIIVDNFDASYEKPEFNYFVESGHLDNFTYSPPQSERKIETIF
ncbi:MAG: S1 RNA-binding domain-containing protein [Oscillospiraceae bacterium]